MKKLGIIIGVICMIFGVSFLIGARSKVCTVTLQDRRWHIELASTPEKREKGLMYRKNLCYTCGMLFVFNEQSPKSFWMKNTRIPLDIYFYDDSGKLVDFVKNMRPEKETAKPMGYTSQTAKYVIEINAGSQLFQPENFDPTQCL